MRYFKLLLIRVSNTKNSRNSTMRYLTVVCQTTKKVSAMDQFGIHGKGTRQNSKSSRKSSKVKSNFRHKPTKSFTTRLKLSQQLLHRSDVGLDLAKNTTELTAPQVSECSSVSADSRLRDDAVSI